MRRGLSDEAVLDLWRDGEGKTLAFQSIKTINGVNAIIECVEEIIYPTEMDVKKSDEEGAETGPPVYGGLETREVGAIFNATPTVGTDFNVVNLVLLPEAVDLKGASDLQPEVSKPMTPVFHSVNVTTTLVLENGSVVVLGQTTDHVSRHRLFLLAGAQLVDDRGRPVEVPRVVPPAPDVKEDD